ncbi:hypothetical protein GQ602_004196 [Ophiocordyceps camponoti-floridani]|uniref:Uncharacterized protein n=1 Tax=Ophiocordyceps camponoti-floridani TaxID=2030778 RepID=A0A8H4Q699_9HYPO|nr:hypothetical protein GQ602_004196 [Ophiocordyceps camponoti-floridani]
MEALNFLVNNIPDWLRQLDNLSGQIDLRQAELAAFNAQQAPASRAASLRNKGSAESLKPKDDGPLHIDAEPVSLPSHGQEVQDDTRWPAVPELESANLLAVQKKAREAVAAAHLRSRTQMRSKRVPVSVRSAEAAPSSYPTRSMIIVYYDQFVQLFFDSLVRYIASGRNHLRKARMAATMAHINRMAERELQDTERADDEEKTAPDSLPSLRYMATTRRSGAMSAVLRSELGASRSDNQSLDVFESLDKSLDAIHGLSEHGAHQFLRVANCEDEIIKIQARMREMVAVAQREIERIQRQNADSTNESQNADSADDSGDGERARPRRALSIRRELADGLGGEASSENGAQVASATPEELTPEEPVGSVIGAVKPLEVDDSEDPDEGIDVMLPKLQYRSTRYMRTRAS